MSRFVILIDQAKDGWRLLETTVRLAERMGADGVAAIVARPREWHVLTACEMGTPGFGFASYWTPPMMLAAETNRAADVEAFFQECDHEATCRGLHCETQWTRLTVLRAAAAVSRLFGLVVICREAMLDELGEATGIGDLCSAVEHPLLVTSRDSQEWQRIVIVGDTPQELHELMQWGTHWSEQLDLPLLPLELPLSRLDSRFTWKGLWRRLSARAHRTAVRESLLAVGLGPSDLLLVGRRPIAWPTHDGPLSISPNDLVEMPLGAVGFLPTTHSSAACQFLFSAFDSFDAPAMPPHGSFSA